MTFLRKEVILGDGRPFGGHSARWRVKAPDASSPGTYLVVRLDGHEYAIESARLLGLLQARGLGLTPIEEESPRRWFAQVHGRRIPVVVPHTLLQLREHSLGARSCLLLIGNEEDTDVTAAEFALLADSVSRLERVPPQLCRDDPESEYAGARVRIGEKWRDVLDLERLAQACLEAKPDGAE